MHKQIDLLILAALAPAAWASCSYHPHACTDCGYMTVYAIHVHVLVSCLIVLQEHAASWRPLHLPLTSQVFRQVLSVRAAAEPTFKNEIMCLAASIYDVNECSHL